MLGHVHNRWYPDASSGTGCELYRVGILAGFGIRDPLLVWSVTEIRILFQNTYNLAGYCAGRQSEWYNAPRTMQVPRSFDVHSFLTHAWKKTICTRYSLIMSVFGRGPLAFSAIIDLGEQWLRITSHPQNPDGCLQTWWYIGIAEPSSLPSSRRIRIVHGQHCTRNFSDQVNAGRLLAWWMNVSRVNPSHPSCELAFACCVVALKPQLRESMTLGLRLPVRWNSRSLWNLFVSTAVSSCWLFCCWSTTASYSSSIANTVATGRKHQSNEAFHSCDESPWTPGLQDNSVFA